MSSNSFEEANAIPPQRYGGVKPLPPTALSGHTSSADSKLRLGIVSVLTTSLQGIVLE